MASQLFMGWLSSNLMMMAQCTMLHVPILFCITMILEIASLQVSPNRLKEFEAAFLQAQKIISSMPGYVLHELQRCVEREGHYMLLVKWRSLEDHEQGFRKSPQYLQWKALLHHFYDPFPTVLHYQSVDEASGVAP